jgi:3-dehydroquinate synthase
MLQARTIPVQIKEAAYEVVVQPLLLGTAGNVLRRLSSSKKCAVITDERVGPLHGPLLLESLKDAGFETILATLTGGEEGKTIAAAAVAYDTLLKAGIERTTPIVALGGGVIGDTAGFVAATILRGVPLVQAPTTLLAMVDASVGGKTGVNHAAGKNLIGAFHQPIAVLIDPSVLKTLPARELSSGLAECIKHDVIRDADGFAKLEKSIDRALSLDIDYLTELVAHNVAIKAKVVASDPFEKGERAHLNLGHTFGHAIEHVSHYSYAHGECVALGMIAAARLAVSLGLLDTTSAERIAALVRKAGLPATGLKLSIDEVVNAMLFDKKVKSGKVRFILPDRIGHVVIRDDVPEPLVRKAIESLA